MDIVKSDGAITLLPPVEIVEKLVTNNDLKLLTPQQRLDYYVWRCRSIGVDPNSQPFEYLTLDGKLCLYPKAQLADQLRETRGLSVTLGASALEHGVYTRIATASDRDGRKAENIGAVAVIYPEQRKVWRNNQSSWEPHPQAGQQYVGVELANAIKKAATQAQRRATFSLVGLGGTDTDDVEGVQRIDVAAVHDPKGLLPTDNAPTPQPATATDGPVSWSDSDTWPPTGIEETTGSVLKAERKKAKTGAEYVRAVIEDITGETAVSTFSESGMAAIERCVGKIVDAKIANTGRGYKLLEIKECNR